MMAGPKAAAVLETAAGLLLPALELLRGLDSVFDSAVHDLAMSCASLLLAMSYTSLLFVAFVVVPPSRLSFSLLWLYRISLASS